MKIVIFFIVLSMFFTFSSSWTWIWISLELNSYSFVILNKDVLEFQFKYFFIQAMGTIFFVSSYMMNSNLILCISLMIKLSAAPYFMWIYPSVKWLDYKCLMIFFSLQKVAPFFYLYNMNYNSKLLFVIILHILLSVSMGTMGAMMKKSFLDMILFSSIYQMGWILYMIMFNQIVSFLYFFAYIVSVIMIMEMKKKTFLLSENMKYIYLFMFMLMSGLPLTMIFLMKIMMMESYLNYNLLILLMINLMTLVMMIFNYLKIHFFYFHNTKNFMFSYFMSYFFIALIICMMLISLFFMI